MKTILYGDKRCANTNVIYPLIKVSGIENKIEFKKIDLEHGDQLKRRYIKKFPAHHVPAIEVGDFRTDESSAVAKYICRTFPEAQRFYPENIEVRAYIDRALDWRQVAFAHHIGSALINMVWGVSSELDFFNTPEFFEYNMRQVEDDLKYLDEYLLQDRAFIAGDVPSIAEMSIIAYMPYFIVLTKTKYEIKLPQNIQQWVDRYYKKYPKALEAQQEEQIPLMQNANKRLLEDKNHFLNT